MLDYGIEIIILAPLYTNDWRHIKEISPLQSQWYAHFTVPGHIIIITYIFKYFTSNSFYISIS